MVGNGSRMKYSNVVLEGFGYVIPENVVRTSTIEDKLLPALNKLGIPKGRIEFLTGLKERRFWDDGTRPSQYAAEAVRRALSNTGTKTDEVGLIISSSVCRDYLEPSMASLIAHQAGLPQSCILFDVSNACLGFASAMAQAANMIELGQVDKAVVVSCEAGSEVVENSIRKLLHQPSEELLLSYIPTLTLGSAAVALVMSSAKGKTGPKIKFHGGATLNDSSQCELCKWGPDTGFPSSVTHTMQTDGKALLEKGTVLASHTWRCLEAATGVSRPDVDVFFCHQVGILHRNAVFDMLGLDVSKDFGTYEYMGNTGSAALPLTTAVGIEKGVFRPGDKAVMMGIGSGLVCTMYSVEWEL